MADESSTLAALSNAANNLAPNLKGLLAGYKTLASEIKNAKQDLSSLYSTQEKLGELAGKSGKGSLSNTLRNACTEAERLNNALREQHGLLEKINGGEPKTRQEKLKRIVKLQEEVKTSGQNIKDTGDAVLGTVKTPVKAFMDDESSSLDLKSSMMDNSGKVSEKFQAINALAIRFGEKLPGTNADYRSMMISLHRMGASYEEILTGLGEATANFAVQMKMPADQAAEAILKMRHSTHAEDKDMLKVIDLMQRGFYAAGGGRADLQAAFSSMQSAFNTIPEKGYQAAQQLAPLILMASKNGTDGSVTGASLGRIFQSVMDEKKMGDANKGMGITLDFSNGKGEFGGMPQFFAQLEKVKQLGAPQRQIFINNVAGIDAGAQQAISLLINQGLSGYQDVQKKMAAQASLQDRVNQQLGSLKNQWESVTDTFSNLLVSAGGALAPELSHLVTGIGEVVKWLKELMQENPRLTKAFMIVLAAVGSLITLFGVLMLALAAILAPFALVSSALISLTTITEGFSLAMGAASVSIAPYIIGFIAIAAIAALIYAYWEPIKNFFISLWQSIRASFSKFNMLDLINPLIKPVILIASGWTPIKNFFVGIWQSVSSAFSKFSISAYIAPITKAAQSLMQYWQPIKSFFMGIWNQIKTAFSGSIKGIATLILNWSPLGLIYRAWAGVLRWFGVSLPAKFTDFGKNLMSGMVNGILHGLTGVKDAVLNVGSSAVRWFKDKLGIKSPSRVFTELGHFTMQGLNVGMDAGQHGPLQTLSNFSRRLIAAGTVSIAAPAFAAAQYANPIQANAAHSSTATSSISINIHAAPGMDEKAIARQVAVELERWQRNQKAQSRARLRDLD